VAVGNFDLKIPTENIPSVNPLVFSEFLVVNANEDDNIHIEDCDEGNDYSIDDEEEENSD
jgi:hypothetical protein